MGDMVKEELCVKVVDVRMASWRVMTVIEENVLRLISGYAPQSGRCLDEKQVFMTR